MEKIHAACFELIAKMEVKNGWMLWPMRIALSGMQFTPGGGIEIAAILGPRGVSCPPAGRPGGAVLKPGGGPRPPATAGGQKHAP